MLLQALARLWRALQRCRRANPSPLSPARRRAASARRFRPRAAGLVRVLPIVPAARVSGGIRPLRRAARTALGCALPRTLSGASCSPRRQPRALGAWSDGSCPRAPRLIGRDQAARRAVRKAAAPSGLRRHGCAQGCSAPAPLALALALTPSTDAAEEGVGHRAVRCHLLPGWRLRHLPDAMGERRSHLRPLVAPGL